MSGEARGSTETIDETLLARISAGREDPTATGAAAGVAAQRVAARIAAAGLADVTYTQVDSPLGALLLAATKRGLVRVAFAEEDVDAVLERLAGRISPRIIEASAPFEPARRELDEYFSRRRRSFHRESLV